MDKKEFLKQFKSTVKGEGGNLNTEYILWRMKMGDISEGDISSFNRYIPFQLALAIDSIMGRRKLLGILKTVNEISDNKAGFNKNTSLATTIRMIKDNVITYDDIMSVDYPMTKDIAKAISSQIDKFVKMVIGYKDVTKDLKNKEKFKIERLLRMKIISSDYLEEKKQIREELKIIFGKDELYRYLKEDPYDTEIKELLDSYSLDENVSKYLPEKYVQYFMKEKIGDADGKSSYKKRRKISQSTQVTKLSKKDISDLQNILLKERSKKTKPITQKIDTFSDKKLMDIIQELERKETKKEASGLVTKLRNLGFETKSSRKVDKNTIFSKIKKQYTKEQKQRQKLEDELSVDVKSEDALAPVSRNVVTNLYSVQKKLDDIKRGKSSRYLSRLDKSKLESQLIDIMKKEKTVKKTKKSMDVDLPYTSPVGSDSSSPRSSISSILSGKGSSRSSISGGRSSRSSTTSNGSVGKFKKEKEQIPMIIPSSLLQLGKTSSGDLDIDTMKVMSSFVGKSIPFSGSKRPSKDSKKLNIDIQKLKGYADEERKSEMKSSLKRRRSSASSSGKLSPYDMKRIDFI